MKIFLILDKKFKETAGSRTDASLKNVLISTYSAMFGTIHFTALVQVMDLIEEKPQKDDLTVLNKKIFDKMEAMCLDLGCTFTTDLKTNTSAMGKTKINRILCKIIGSPDRSLLV